MDSSQLVKPQAFDSVLQALLPYIRPVYGTNEVPGHDDSFAPPAPFRISGLYCGHGIHQGLPAADALRLRSSST
jgi:hypothetical protein